MWKCICGKECNDDHAFCTSCGKQRNLEGIDATETKDNDKKLILKECLKDEDKVYTWCIALLGPIWTFIVTSLTDLFVMDIPAGMSGGTYVIIALIILDAIKMKKKGIKLTKYAVIGCLLLPSVYLFGRAKATNGDKRPAIIRLCFEIFGIILVIVAVILMFAAPRCLRP